MVDSIKITALGNLGANINYTGLIPVVNMNGDPITQKANLQIIGNYILNEAGGANMVRAAQANLALSVANAAQPNITSVGTLTSLSVIGNINSSGNLNIAVNRLRIPGGTNGYVLQTDGAGNLSWTAQSGNGGGGNASPGGANTQIQFNDAGTFGGNSGFTFDKTTGILSVDNLQLVGNAIAGNVYANSGTIGAATLKGEGGNISNIRGANVSGVVASATSATSATTAGTVTTAAQPNITSVGTLSILGVNGNITAANITANIGIFTGNGSGLSSITGANVTGTVPVANVAQYANVQPANANITNYSLALVNWIAGNHRIEADLNNLKFNANTYTLSTVNIVANNSANIGNFRISGQNMSSDQMTIQTSNGIINIQGKTNVTVNSNNGDYEWTFGSAGDLILPNNSNIAVVGNITQFNTCTNGFLGLNSYDAGGNNIAKVDIDGIDGFVRIGTYDPNTDIDYNWTFDPSGNLTLPTNTFAVNYANGTQVSLGGSNTGNVTFDDNIVIGTGDEYGYSGLYLAPGTNSTANLQYLRVRGGDYPTHIHLDTGNNQYYDQYFGADSRFVKLEANGNVVINADDYNGNSGTWSFTTDGNLILAGGNSVIQSIANSSLDPVNPNVSTMALIPDANYNSQSLVLDPTSPGHIHLRSPAFSNIDAPSANLFLGGEDTSFEVTNGLNNVAKIHSGGNTWTFGNTGNLTLPTISLGESTDEQAVISSQRKLIPPFRYSAVIDGATPTIVYTATDVYTTSMKVTMQIQHAGLGMEFFEVFATFTGADTYYTVGSRVAPPTIDASTVVVGLTGTPAMEITVTINSGATTSWVTYDAVEFGIAVD